MTINVESSCLFFLHRKHDHQILIDLMLLFWGAVSRSKSCHITCSCGSQTRFHLKITQAFLWHGLCVSLPSLCHFAFLLTAYLLLLDCLLPLLSVRTLIKYLKVHSEEWSLPHIYIDTLKGLSRKHEVVEGPSFQPLAMLEKHFFVKCHLTDQPDQMITSWEAGFFSSFDGKKLTHLFAKDTLNWSKVKENTFIMLQKMLYFK